MRNLFLALLVAVSFMSCEKEEIITDTSGGTSIETPDIEVEQNEATILGRWKSVGFDEVIRYDFTENKRFTIYGDGSGEFPTLDEFVETNPNLHGNDWTYEGETVVVDLNFGNYSRLIPNFKCNNSVIDWIGEDGTFHSTFYRVDHDISECN